MDPDETLANLCEAAFDGDTEALMEAAENLRDWLKKGGFPPNPDDLLDSLEE